VETIVPRALPPFNALTLQDDPRTSLSFFAESGFPSMSN
jgi:hypothetical protein